MAVENLIIYQKAFDFFVWQKSVVNHLAKVHKYSLGIKIEDESLNLLTGIIRANMTRGDKARAIEECLVSLEVLKILFRAGHVFNRDGGIGVRQYAIAGEKLIELGNLCGAWYKKFQIR